MNTDIRELLPQQPPFVMVDRMVHFDNDEISTSFYVAPDNIFVEDGALTESGIIENIAQTAAARMGYINKYILKEEIKLGFIGEIKNLLIERTPKVNEELITTVTVVKEILSTLLVKTRTKVKDEIIASGEMKIFMTDIS
jgi:predicted hotdog family 3-hydroxylacyl-ACP dehydratase